MEHQYRVLRVLSKILVGFDREQAHIHTNIQKEVGGAVQTRPVSSYNNELHVVGVLWPSICPSQEYSRRHNQWHWPFYRDSLPHHILHVC